MDGLVLALMIPFIGTTLGSGFVFFMKEEMPAKLQKTLLGFASGVMVAASIWSLLIPSMEMCSGMGKAAVVPAAVGLLAGMAFLLLLDTITPHLHIGNAVVKEGCQAYGDQHPRFGFPESANDTEQLADFFTVLKEEGFFSKENPYVLSLEVKPWANEDGDIILAGTKRVINRAWALVED